jgi:adhesin/invasin
MKKKAIIFACLMFSGLSYAQEKVENKTSNIENIEKILGNKSAQAIIDKTKQDALNNASSLAVTKTKSYLETLFPTVEVSLGLGDPGKPTGGVLVVSPLSNPKDIYNTTFAQGSVFLNDNRQTVNIGLGHRILELDKKLLLGINAFYDHEFPYDHQRTSIGFEARSSIGEINTNKYWALTKWRAGRDGSDERALDGQDIEAAVPLPYINWAKASVRHFRWDAVDGVSDLKGNDYSLRAEIPMLPGFSIEAGRRDYKSKSDENFVRITWSPKAPVDTLKTPQLVSNEAYTLTSMEDRRYEKVRRENLIIKQKRKAGGVNLVGY